MTDYTTLATETLTTLQPFLELGGKEILKTAAKDAWEKIKKVFSKSDEVIVVEEFEENPKQNDKISRLEELLKMKFSQDENFYKFIYSEILNIKKSDDYKVIINQTGNDNISISGNITGSNININK